MSHTHTHTLLSYPPFLTSSHTHTHTQTFDHLLRRNCHDDDVEEPSGLELSPAFLFTVGDPVALPFLAGARDVGGGGGGPAGRRRSEHARGLLLLPDVVVVVVAAAEAAGVVVVVPLAQLTVGYLREAAAVLVGRAGGALFAAKNGDDDTTEDLGCGTGFLAPSPSLLCLSGAGAEAEAEGALGGTEEGLFLSSSKETEGDVEGLYLRQGAEEEEEDEDSNEEEPPPLVLLPLP